MLPKSLNLKPLSFKRFERWMMIRKTLISSEITWSVYKLVWILFRNQWFLLKFEVYILFFYLSCIFTFSVWKLIKFWLIYCTDQIVLEYIWRFIGFKSCCLFFYSSKGSYQFVNWTKKKLIVLKFAKAYLYSINKLWYLMRPSTIILVSIRLLSTFRH